MVSISCQNSTILDCYSTAEVTLNDWQNAGGLAGALDGTIVENCYAYGNVYGQLKVGGFAGIIMENSSITNCKAYGNVYGQHKVGGFAGAAENAVIKNCLARGNISGKGNHSYFTLNT